MGMVEKILKVIKTERECVIRQRDISKCDRRCSECDLCLAEEEILEVYDLLIKVYDAPRSRTQKNTLCDGGIKRNEQV